jgi:NADH:ubiquinone oxidoreductase subunit K
LKNIASTGKTVVCTIHQPSSEVFALFDRILLMAEGRTAFLGPVGDALSFFSAQGLPCPPNYNPADYYIHTLATIPGQEVESKKKSREICDAYVVSTAGQQILEIVKANRSFNLTESQEFQLDDVKVKRSPYKASWFAQFRAVFWRSLLSVLREPAVLRVKAFQTIVISICGIHVRRNQLTHFFPLQMQFISVLIALIYQGQTLQYDNVRNIQGALFIFLTNMTFQNVFGVVNVSPTFLFYFYFIFLHYGSLTSHLIIF